MEAWAYNTNRIDGAMRFIYNISENCELLTMLLTALLLALLPVRLFSQ
jgi:hypothetical protein